MTPGTILVLAALAVLVVAGTRLGFGNRSLPRLLGPVVETGAVFILLGALIGPVGANLLTASLLAQLSPLVVIGLGWIGFLYGSHFEWRLVRRYPGPLYAAALFQAVFSFAVVAGASWLLLTYLLAGAFPGPERLAAALVLGICASGTAPAGVFHLTSRRRLASGDLNALRFFAAVDDLPGLLLLGLMGAFTVIAPAGGPALAEATAMAEATAPAGGLALAPWLRLLLSLGLAVAMGVGLGLLTHWLFPDAGDIRHSSLILLGIVALGAGAAALLGLSPLFVMVLAGMVFANLSTRKESAYGLLAEREHTLYVVFLLVAGMLFRFEWTVIFLLTPAYLVLRWLGKLVGNYAGSRVFLPRGEISPWIGTGMFFQGGMALAIAVSFQHAFPIPFEQQVTAAIVMGVLVGDLLAPPLAGLALGARRNP